MLKSILLHVLTLFALVYHCVYAQPMDTTVKRLLEHQLIERKQLKALETILQNENVRSSALYLHALYQVEFQKEYKSYYVLTTIVYDNVNLDKEERTKIQKELTAYLAKLRSSGLINDKHVQVFQGRIDNDEFITRIQLLASISEEVAFEEYMDPAKLKDFADKLKNFSIVTSMYDELIETIEHGKLERPIWFLKYSDKAIIINLEDYPTQPQDYLEKIHRKTASIIPELAFSDFAFQVVLDSASSATDSQSYDFVVSLNSNGRTYRQKSFYRIYSPDRDEYFGGGIDQQEYYKIFNKILADMQSPYRLHEVKAYNGNAADDKKFGIIALTKEQAQMLHSGGVYFTPSYESFKNTVTTERIEAAIEAYQKMGLLSNLNPAQIAEARQNISEREVRTFNDVLACFPDVIHVFDMELANLDDPYAELVEAYARISRGAFSPTGTSDNFDIERNGTVTLKFQFNNRRYERKFEIDDDWIDPQFLAFMDGVAKENSLNGQFYQLYTGGQEASVIYLTKTQYEFLRANKFAVFADEWQSVEE